MEIGGWASDSEVGELYQDVVKNDLVENVAELEALGFTIVSPAKVAPPEFHARLRTALMDAHERRSGHRISDTDTDATGERKALSTLWALLLEDRAFEEALLNPVLLTLARYMCGKSAILSDLMGLIKNQDDRPTHTLHSDQVGMPGPMPPYAQVVNLTWTLTEYTEDSGPLAIVPGSHRLGRPPTDYEERFLEPGAPVKAIPIQCEAGSLIVWGGNTWHAAFPRKLPGVRANLLFLFCRPYWRPIQEFRTLCPPEMLERNPPEFAALLGVNHPYPYQGPKAPAHNQLSPLRVSGRSVWS